MNKGKYDALDVANYIVNYCIDKGTPVSNLKLQKLLYYVQAASLVEDKTCMFRDDISAWKYGPVVENVYHNFKLYIDKNIDNKIKSKELFWDYAEDDQYSPEDIISENDGNLIKKVVDSYLGYDALTMVKKTHQEAPWLDAYNNNKDVIDAKEIEKFYSINKELLYGKHM